MICVLKNIYLGGMNSISSMSSEETEVCDIENYQAVFRGCCEWLRDEGYIRFASINDEVVNGNAITTIVAPVVTEKYMIEHRKKGFLDFGLTEGISKKGTKDIAARTAALGRALG